jgi:ureidoglycolate lyase
MGNRTSLVLSDVDPQAFAPYGWVLGKPVPDGGDAVAYTSAASDFWQEHVFDVGRGEPEILWVTYRDVSPIIDRLEVHRLTEQAVVPLTGEIVQIVGASSADGALDPQSVKAFRVPVGQGICMRPGCWHATRVLASEATCLMLTRRSTTSDLIGHLTAGHPLAESTFCDVKLQLLR